MKGIWKAVAALCVVLMFGGICGAAPSTDERRVLRVGYVPGTGFLEEDRPGHLRGYGYEYMESLANYGNWKFEYIPANSWQECGAMLQSGEVDTLPEMPGNYRILPNVKRTDHVVGRVPMELVVSAYGVKPHMKIGTFSSSYPIPGFPKIAAGEGFTYDLVNYPLFYDMEEAFRRGELDGYVDPMFISANEKNVLAIFDRQSYRLLVRADQKELLDQLNFAMDQLLLYQPNIRDRLNNKYSRQNGLPLILNREEREYLQNVGSLKAVIHMRQRPYVYSESGRLQGVIPELAKKISEDLGVEVRIVETSNYDEAMETVKSGKADFMLDAIRDFSWAEGLNMQLTQSYMGLEYVAVKRRGTHADIDKATVACIPNLLYSENFVQTRFPEERRVTFPSIEECFDAVSEGRADVVFVPRSEVSYLIENTGTYNLVAESESEFSETIGIGVYKHADRNLWGIMNKELNHLNSDWLRDAFIHTSAASHELTPQWLLYHYPAQVFGAMLVVVAAILGFVWYRFYMRRRHLSVVQHMAYTDSRYDLPNLAWLGDEVPKILEGMDRKVRESLYVVTFSLGSTAAVVEMYGDELIVHKMVDLAGKLGSSDWVLLTATGEDAGHLICLCKAQDDKQISNLVTNVIDRHGFIVTAEARIWLHMRAGICALNLENSTLQQAVQRSVTACHELHGTNGGIRLFDDKLQEDLLLQQSIEENMEKALAKCECKAWYQPKYDIETKKIIGAEALVRWQSEELGFMPPGKFIPLFEKNGFVISVDYALLDQAFRFQKKRLDEGKEVVPISVNQSRLHITEDGYLEKMKAIVKKYRLPKGLIELEVTETMFGDFDQKSQQNQASYIIRSLHELGFTISVDDFGSGYSSFMMLNYLPMDVMKIDRSLLSTSDDSQRMRSILGNVIRLGKSLNMHVICEGIETEEQEKLLLELGCRYGQGFLNAKPMPEKEFVEFFENRNRSVANG